VKSDIGQKRKMLCSQSQIQDPFASPIKTLLACPSETSSPVESPYPGEEMEDSNSDGLEDLWKDMSLAMEYSKVICQDNIFVCAPENIKMSNIISISCKTTNDLTYFS
jgi:hypothetical protein